MAGRAVIGYTFTAYCGVRCDPVCSDVHGVGVVYAVFDPDELEARLERLSKDEVESLLKEIEEFEREMEAHANACSADICISWRRRRWFEKELELLKRLGVKYEVVEKSCGDATEEDWKLVEEESVSVMGLIEEFAMEKYPDLLGLDP